VKKAKKTLTVSALPSYINFVDPSIALLIFSVDVQAATKYGIIFANEATASSEDVAEHAVMLIFEAYKKKHVQDRMLKDWVRTGTKI
jgi:hypothetical protein